MTPMLPASRELDSQVAMALGWTKIQSNQSIHVTDTRHDFAGIKPGGFRAFIPHYTTNPDDLAPLAEMLRFLTAQRYRVTIDIFPSEQSPADEASASAHHYDDGHIIQGHVCDSLKHAVAMLVLGQEARDD